MGTGSACVSCSNSDTGIYCNKLVVYSEPVLGTKRCDFCQTRIGTVQQYREWPSWVDLYWILKDCVPDSLLRVSLLERLPEYWFRITCIKVDDYSEYTLTQQYKLLRCIPAIPVTSLCRLYDLVCIIYPLEIV